MTSKKQSPVWNWSKIGRAAERAGTVGVTPERAMQLVPGWEDADTITVEPMLGGRTNSSYRVMLGAETFVLRINAANEPALGIDYEREFEILKHVYRGDVGPEPVYFSPEAGVLVTRFVEGDVLSAEEVRKPVNIERIVRSLKKLHALPAPRHRLNLETVVSRYCKTVEEARLHFSEALVNVRPKALGLVREWSRGIDKVCLCHNDLFHSNIIDGKGIRFIDWEYAGTGDPLFELAAITQYHKFTEHHTDYLLEHYFGESSNSIRHRMRRTQAVFDLLCILWVLAFRASAGGTVLPEAGSEGALIEHAERLSEGANSLRGWD